MALPAVERDTPVFVRRFFSPQTQRCIDRARAPAMSAIRCQSLRISMIEGNQRVILVSQNKRACDM